MKKGFLIGLMVLTAFLLATTVVFAQEIATMSPQSSTYLKDLIDDSINPLNPIVQAKGIDIKVASPESAIWVPDKEAYKNKILTVFLNVLNSAPTSSRIIVAYDNSENSLKISLPDKVSNYNVEREITDVQGNTYTLKSRQGYGEEYCVKF